MLYDFIYFGVLFLVLRVVSFYIVIVNEIKVYKMNSDLGKLYCIYELLLE